MSSIIKVDTIQDQDGNNIINENANTITIGKSGDTVTVAAGASFVGGGIEWQSTIVTTSTLTAVAGNGYWIDTTSNACTITLPGSASVGDQIIFVDYKRTWGTNAVTINTNSLNFQGNTSPNPVYDTNGETVSIVYSGATQGWIPIDDGAVALETPQPITADFLVIAGGGGGGRGVGGGGGAGGYRNSYNSESSGGGGSAESYLTLTAGATYTITVGGGGTGGSSGTSPAYYGTNGSNSSISGTGITTITSIGGGGSGTQNTSPYVPNSGGSGGGGIGSNSPSIPQTAGSGTANQGYDGGVGSTSAPDYCSGGGGGAGAIGGNASGTNGGNGGNGVASTITGSSVTRGGGGGGSGRNTGISGTGGTGGGGNGGTLNTPGTAGSTNTGGGGGGSHDVDGANGGSGVVIFRIPTSQYTGTTTGSPTVTTDGTDTILLFNASGSYTA
jgi:hypothetical protein